MQELEVLSNPSYENQDEYDHLYLTPVADNEDDGYMNFVQYLSL